MANFKNIQGPDNRAKEKSMEQYPEDKITLARQVMIDYIEGMTGCIGIWHQWNTQDIAKLFSELQWGKTCEHKYNRVMQGNHTA